MQISTHQTTLYSLHLNADEFADLVYALSYAECNIQLGSAQKILDFYESLDD